MQKQGPRPPSHVSPKSRKYLMMWELNPSNWVDSRRKERVVSESRMELCLNLQRVEKCINTKHNPKFEDSVLEFAPHECRSGHVIGQ